MTAIFIFLEIYEQFAQNTNNYFKTMNFITAIDTL